MLFSRTSAWLCIYHLFVRSNLNFLHISQLITLVCCRQDLFKIFGPVKPKLRVIPSGQENYSKPEHLNVLGKELNVINITKQ